VFILQEAEQVSLKLNSTVFSNDIITCFLESRGSTTPAQYEE